MASSVYQKIHAFALNAQAHHRLQLKGLHQAAADTYRTDRNQRFQCDNLDVKQEPLIVPLHKPQHHGPRGDLPYDSALDSPNSIDKVVLTLRYSSIPHLSFGGRAVVRSPNQSKKRVMRSDGDGWFDDLEFELPDGYTLYSYGSDTDSPSSAPPPTNFNGKNKHWVHSMTDEMVEQGGGSQVKERFDKNLSRTHNGNKAQSSTTTPDIQNTTPLKGMARLRRISPRSIRTTG